MPFAHFDAANGKQAVLAELAGLVAGRPVAPREGLLELTGQAAKAGDMGTGLSVGLRR